MTYKAPLDPNAYTRRSVDKKWVSWTDRAGVTRSSFPWLVDDDIARDAVGADNWEVIGYFGAYRTITREAALAMLARKLEERGFDPANAEAMLNYN